jgi:hypothetical protein
MLISKDENIKTSSVYVASLILKLFRKKRVNKLSIFEIVEHLKKYKIIHYRNMFFGLAFLYSSGVVDFKEPYIILVSESWERGVGSPQKEESGLLFDYQ